MDIYRTKQSPSGMLLIPARVRLSNNHQGIRENVVTGYNGPVIDITRCHRCNLLKYYNRPYDGNTWLRENRAPL